MNKHLAELQDGEAVHVFKGDMSAININGVIIMGGPKGVVGRNQKAFTEEEDVKAMDWGFELCPIQEAATTIQKYKGQDFMSCMYLQLVNNRMASLQSTH